MFSFADNEELTKGLMVSLGCFGHTRFVPVQKDGVLHFVDQSVEKEIYIWLCLNAWHAPQRVPACSFGAVELVVTAGTFQIDPERGRIGADVVRGSRAGRGPNFCIKSRTLSPQLLVSSHCVSFLSSANVEIFE